MSEDIKARLIGAQEKINGFLANRLDIDTSRVVSVMDRVATGTTSGIESVAKVAARVESPMGSSVLKRWAACTADRQRVGEDRRQDRRRRQADRKPRGRRTTAAKVVKTVKAKAKPALRRAFAHRAQGLMRHGGRRLSSATSFWSNAWRLAAMKLST